MMTVFSNAGNGFLAGKQVVPIDHAAEASQKLVDASHCNNLKSALDLIADPYVDVNFIGTVCLKARKTVVVLHEETAHEVRVELEEFKTEVTALFLAAHAGNVTLVRKLLSVGADVNQKLFRGYATTAAVREGHLEILQTLMNAGASQPACEEALLEASYCGRAPFAELLMASEMIRPHAAVHALVTASCRGFVDVVHTLIKCGVDANATDRMLLQSSKPSIHTNVNCNALAAAIVSRQVSVVRLLLQAGVRVDIKVRLGAWSWDTATGEEFRVGVGLAEPYSVTWCAVEYFEASGAILRMLLQHYPVNDHHFGRTLVHHAILCGNAGALDVLLNCGADLELPVKTTKSRTELHPIHLAAQFGSPNTLQCLINAGCNLNSRTASGESALMISTRCKHEECLRSLASAGADFGLVDAAGQSACSIASSTRWTRGFRRAVLHVMHTGSTSTSTVASSDSSVFSPLIFATRANDVVAIKKLIERQDIDVDQQDQNGFSAAMVAAASGQVDAFRLLVYAGANMKLHNKYGETVLTLISESNHDNGALFEKVILEYTLERGNHGSAGFYPLHCAARCGDLALARELVSCYDVNFADGDGYTPLMLAARGGHGSMCELLISSGAMCEIKNERDETALTLARKNAGFGKDAERVILDELARTLVLGGAPVKKHTKKGKGTPHAKLLKMVEGAGVLRWGKSSKRNVVCRGAELGPSTSFRWNRRRKPDADEPGLFHVVTTKNKEVHFAYEGGLEVAELWVRGIKLVTREAIFGKKIE